MSGDLHTIVPPATTDQQIQTESTNRTNGMNQNCINDEANIVACDYVNYRLRKAGFDWPDSPTLPTERPRYCSVMRKLGDEFEQRFAGAFHDMVTTLQITPTNAAPSFLSVCDELFRGNGNDAEITWGKVIALHAFVGALAVQCVDKEMPQLVKKIAEWLADYTRVHLNAWINSHGGWNGLVQYYEHGDGEMKWPSLKTVIGMACGAVGVVTLAHMLVGRP